MDNIKIYFIEPEIINKEENVTNYINQTNKDKIFFNYRYDKLNSAEYVRKLYRGREYIKTKRG